MNTHTPTNTRIYKKNKSDRQGPKGTVKKVSQKASDWVQDAAIEVAVQAENAAEAAHGTIDDLNQTASQALDKASEAVESAQEKVLELALESSKMAEGAQEKLLRAAVDAEDFVGRLRQRLDETTARFEKRWKAIQERSKTHTTGGTQGMTPRNASSPQASSNTLEGV